MSYLDADMSAIVVMLVAMVAVMMMMMMMMMMMIVMTGHFKTTTWPILILIRAIRVLGANPSNPQSGGLRPI